MEESTSYLTIDPKSTTIPVFHQMMLGSIAPRPIALVSTMDQAGNPNLSPFSFFNAFGANPPIVIFSPSRRGKDNTTKHTYENVKEVPEVVINAVNFSMVQQVSDASADFPKGVNEFVQVGLTMQTSDLVKPFRVAESPVQMECKVLQVIETGYSNAAGNLVICEILRMHVHPGILDQAGRIDPHKADLVGRLGGEYYVRASGSSLFELAKPNG
jgi:flavin reductase (DIM6/NTAB) family NADH-FMN oxidoreductase RutF